MSVTRDQAAVRRIASLVADGAPRQDVFDAVTAEIAALASADAATLSRFEPDDTLHLVAAAGDVGGLPVGRRRPAPPQLAELRATGRPVRLAPLDDAAPYLQIANGAGIAVAVGVPVTIEAGVWGLVFAGFRDPAAVPDDVEERIAAFTALVATALVNAERRADLQRLIDEQTALRRVAELVACDASLEEVLQAVVEEAASLLGVDLTNVVRYEDGDGGSAVIMATQGAGDRLRPGMRADDTHEGTVGQVRATGRSARIDDLAAVPGTWTRLATELGYVSSAGAPIVIEGRVWGAMTALSKSGALSSTAERHLAEFAELTGTAIAGASARAELRAIADEQGSLRRVAELVARNTSQQEVLETVAREASRLIDGHPTTLMRVEPGGGAAVCVAVHEGPVPVGARIEIAPQEQGTVAQIIRTRRPARRDSYLEPPGRAWARDRFHVHSSVGVPIIVADEVWGVLGVTSQSAQLPPDSEVRLDQFAQLVAAALANAQARESLQRVVDEQSALRRVAELVARAAAPEEVFGAVTQEASRLLDDQAATLVKFEPGRLVFAVVATHNGPAPAAREIPYRAGSVADRVRSGRRTERIDDYALEIDAAQAAELGVRAAVHVPILVADRVWGLLSATSADGPLPRATEPRLVQFADLAGTAIAHAESRFELLASRARVVATADETRRRIQRDLHDGAQRRLVQTIITLKLARDALGEGDAEAVAEWLDESLTQAEQTISDLRDLVRGILPASLASGGLAVGVASLVEGLPLPVSVDVDPARLPERVETTAYFVVAEALTNVVKHARASRVFVVARQDRASGCLVVEVRDDGRGGADAGAGTGLMGLRDRVDALEGTLEVASPPGGGTTVRVTLPLA